MTSVVTVGGRGGGSSRSGARRPPEPWRLLEDVLANSDPATPVPVVARGLAWRGRVTLLSSREGVGKSTLVGAAAAAVTRGETWLDEATIAGPVVILDLEEHLDDLARRLALLNADATQTTVGTTLPPPEEEHETAVSALSKVVKRMRPVLVVVDSLAALGARTGSVSEAGSSAQWTPLLSELTAIARDHDCAVLLIHHSKKAGDEYRDSTAIGAAVDVVALLKGEDDQPDNFRRLTYPKSRFPVDPLALLYEGDHYRVLLGNLSVAERVLSHIQSDPGCSLRTLRAKVKGKAEDIDAAVAKLIAERRVEKRGGNRRGEAAEFYALDLRPGSGPAEAGHTPGHTPVSPADKAGTHSGRTQDTPPCPPFINEGDTVAGSVRKGTRVRPAKVSSFRKLLKGKKP